MTQVQSARWLTMLIEDTLKTFLPFHRGTSGGWISFNCPMCISRGESRNDTKMRGGLKSQTDLVSYNCFNCGFTASHRQGRLINSKMVELLRSIGVSDTEIKTLQLDAIRSQDLLQQTVYETPSLVRIPNYKQISLPNNTRKIKDIIDGADPDDRAIRAAQYLIERGLYDHTDLFWSSELRYRNRVIIPFYQQDKVVGFSARDFTGKAQSKYLNTMPENFLFNIDKIKEIKSYLIVVEGVLDASALGCVAVMSNTASDIQAEYINQFRGEVIVCADRDKAGNKLVEQAIQHNWSVSYPDWQDDIKDAADAVNRYGKLYTIKNIIDKRVDNQVKNRVYLRVNRRF